MNGGHNEAAISVTHVSQSDGVSDMYIGMMTEAFSYMNAVHHSCAGW